MSQFGSMRPTRRTRQCLMTSFASMPGRGVESAVVLNHLREFQERFEATSTEEGSVMATVLPYVLSDLSTSRRAAILE